MVEETKKDLTKENLVKLCLSQTYIKHPLQFLLCLYVSGERGGGAGAHKQLRCTLCLAHSLHYPLYAPATHPSSSNRLVIQKAKESQGLVLHADRHN